MKFWGGAFIAAALREPSLWAANDHDVIRQLRPAQTSWLAYDAVRRAWVRRWFGPHVRVDRWQAHVNEPFDWWGDGAMFPMQKPKPQEGNEP